MHAWLQKNVCSFQNFHPRHFEPLNYSEIQRASYSTYASRLTWFYSFGKVPHCHKNLLLGSSVSRSTAGVPFSFVSEICSRNGRSISWGSDPGLNPSEPIGFNPCTRFPTFPEFSCLFVLPRWEVSVPHTLLTRFNFSLRTLIYHIESILFIIVIVFQITLNYWLYHIIHIIKRTLMMQLPT